MPDTLGYRKIFGILLPSMNTVVQPECDSLRPEGVTNQVARFSVSTGGEPIDLLEAADRLMTCEPDALVLGISMDAVPGGIEKAQRLREELAVHSGLPVAGGTEASREALRALGTKRIAVVTPFKPAGDTNVRAAFEASGFEVAAVEGLKCENFKVIAEVTAEAVKAAFHMVAAEPVDAVVQVGTALPTVRLVDELEQEFGKPVVAVNAATYWLALRQNGIADRQEGLGRLFADH